MEDRVSRLDATRISRRNVAKGVAWAVPTMSAASVAPAFAASPEKQLWLMNTVSLKDYGQYSTSATENFDSDWYSSTAGVSRWNALGGAEAFYTNGGAKSFQGNSNLLYSFRVKNIGGKAIGGQISVVFEFPVRGDVWYSSNTKTQNVSLFNYQGMSQAIRGADTAKTQKTVRSDEVQSGRYGSPGDSATTTATSYSQNGSSTGGHTWGAYQGQNHWGQPVANVWKSATRTSNNRTLDYYAEMRTMRLLLDTGASPLEPGQWSQISVAFEIPEAVINFGTTGHEANTWASLVWYSNMLAYAHEAGFVTESSCSPGSSQDATWCSNLGNRGNVVTARAGTEGSPVKSSDGLWYFDDGAARNFGSWY